MLERDWMLLMDFDRAVEWICEQPLRLRYRLDDRSASHVPDLWRLRGKSRRSLSWPRSSSRAVQQQLVGSN